MTRAQIGVILILTGALSGCSGWLGQDKEKEALKKRVAELEQQSQATPTPASADVATPEITPQPAATPEPVTAATPVAARRPAAPPAAPKKPVSTTPPVTPDAPAATPAQEPEPPRVARAVETPEPVVIPDGATLELVLETALSSATNAVGDKVVARIASAATDQGALDLPGGCVLTGRVARVQAAKRMGGQAELVVVFDHIKVRGRTQALPSIWVQDIGPDEAKRDRKTVAGGAIAGAVVGGATKGGKGAVKGAIIGALGGAGVAAATKGGDVDVPAGSAWVVVAQRSAMVAQ